MVTRAEFWNIMNEYGSKIWPSQIIFYVIAGVLISWLLIKPGNLPDFFAKLYLSLAFAWNGVLFFLTLAKDIAGTSNGNYINGSLFILVAIIFSVDLFRKNMRFSLPPVRWQKYVVYISLILIFCYPIIGIFSGYDFESLIFPGTHPCPTTALGLILLTLAIPYINKLIFILMIFLAVPFTLFLQIAKYGVFEDIILLFVGLYGLVILVLYWKPGFNNLGTS